MVAKARGYEAGIVYERNPAQYPTAPAGMSGGLIVASASIATADSPYTVPDTIGLLVVDASGGNVVINLGASQGYWLTRQLDILRTDNSNNVVTVNRGGSDTINGATSIKVAGQYSVLRLSYTAAAAWVAYYASSIGGGSGTLSVAGDFALTGWGAGASVSAVTPWADDRRGLITITTGTTAGANPTVAHTIPARPHGPRVLLQPGASVTPAFDSWIVAAETTTLITWQLIAMPANGSVHNVFYDYRD